VKPLRGAVDVLRRGLAARTFSAVSAEIGDVSGPFWAHADGRLGFDSASTVNESTIFDLASLTKVLSATTIALILTREGTLAVDEPIGDAVAEWTAADRSMLTIRDLLEHSSGLPAHREYFRRLIGIDAYVATIAAEPLEYAPRTRSIYSDLGFIILGAALERRARASLAEQFNRWKASAHISDAIAYLPAPGWKARTAITGHDERRGQLLQGDVHDANAAALGGVAAHAGLFGTAGAVGAAARWWLRQVVTEDGRLFVQRSAVPGSSRALGWDTMLPTSSCGTLMPSGAIGHTGFTGTSLWLDPSRNIYFVLLTNRVHASQTTDAIQQLRRDFHDAANRELSS
jgi:CubicO group peptidase (beta-lactamase class C family)